MTRIEDKAVSGADKIVANVSKEFLFEYKMAVLLSLKDSGSLNDTQFRYAVEKLRNKI